MRKISRYNLNKPKRRYTYLMHHEATGYFYIGRHMTMQSLEDDYYSGSGSLINKIYKIQGFSQGYLDTNIPYGWNKTIIEYYDDDESLDNAEVVAILEVRKDLFCLNRTHMKKGENDRLLDSRIKYAFSNHKYTHWSGRTPEQLQALVSDEKERVQFEQDFIGPMNQPSSLSAYNMLKTVSKKIDACRLLHLNK